MDISIKFVRCGALITLFLPCFSVGTPSFTETPSDEERYIGQDIVIKWTYTAPSKNTDFERFSPLWNYYDRNGTRHQLAREDKNKAWNWEIVTSSCPRRLQYPVQRIFKSKPGDQFSASLNITNLTMADSGKYECRLERSFFPAVVNEMNLVVKVASPVTTAIPTTTPTSTTSQKVSTTPSPSTTPGTESTTAPTTELSTGAIIGIVIGVLAVIIVIVVIVVWLVKRSNNNGDNGPKKSNDVPLDAKLPEDGKNTVNPE